MSDGSDTPPAKQKITFFLEKTSGFQTLHADGILGSLTPSGYAFLAFFRERVTIPKTIEHEVKADGTLGKMISKTGKEGVFREFHTGITLTEDGLKQLRQHVDKLLKNFEVAHEQKPA